MRGMTSAGVALLGAALVVTGGASALGHEPDPLALGVPMVAASEAAPSVEYSRHVLAELSDMYGGPRLNNAGQVAGSRDTPDGERAFVWSPGVGLRELPMLGEDAETSAVAINAMGQVAGDVGSDDGWSAFLWDPTAGMRSFGTPAGAVVMGATDLNNLGQVIGYMNVTEGDMADESPQHSHAFLWDAATGIRDLGTLPGGLDSGAVDINDKGQVVGTFDLPETDEGGCCWSHAVLWDPTSGIRDLGTLPGGRSSKAVAINESGQVVGNSDYPAGEDHTFLWDPGTGMQDLGPGQAVDINDAGQVIGTHWDDSVGGHSFEWDPVTGMRDLGTLPGWTGGIRAQDVNNAGQVAGYLYVESDPDRDFLPNRAFVWDPVTGMHALEGVGTGDSRAFAINDAGQVAGTAVPDAAMSRTVAVLWSPPDLWVPTPDLWVPPPAVSAPTSTTVKAKTYFGPYSTTLTKTEKVRLGDLVARIPAGATVTTKVTGMVRTHGATKADKKRALKRAKTVRSYLTKAGLPGTITVSNHGRTDSTSKRARRVNVTITYTQ